MSFGGPGGPDAPISRAANMLMARGKLPAANEGPGRGTVGAVNKTSGGGCRRRE